MKSNEVQKSWPQENSQTKDNITPKPSKVSLNPGPVGPRAANSEEIGPPQHPQGFRTFQKRKAPFHDNRVTFNPYKSLINLRYCVGGDLFDFLKEKISFSENDASDIMK